MKVDGKRIPDKTLAPRAFQAYYRDKRMLVVLRVHAEELEGRLGLFATAAQHAKQAAEEWERAWRAHDYVRDGDPMSQQTKVDPGTSGTTR